MYYVYIIQAINFPELVYVGYTTNIENRLQTHNNGGSIYTAEYKPWKIVWHCVFSNKKRALDFEQYLKTHSGKAFASKRLL